MLDLLLVLLVVLSPPALLTTLGARRRNCAMPVAVVCGIVFPVTWVAWYVRDEQPCGGPYGRRTT